MTDKIKKILEAIPADEWVKASDIEEKTDLSSHEIGAIIKYYMLNELVDRRQTRWGWYYEYRRLIVYSRAARNL